MSEKILQSFLKLFQKDEVKQESQDEDPQIKNEKETEKSKPTKNIQKNIP